MNQVVILGHVDDHTAATPAEGLHVMTRTQTSAIACHQRVVDVADVTTRAEKIRV